MKPPKAKKYIHTKILPLNTPITGFFPVFAAIPIVKAAKTLTHRNRAFALEPRSLLSDVFVKRTVPPLTEDMVHGRPNPTQMFRTWLPKALLTAMAP